MCGGGGGQPQDNSDKVAAIEAQSAREARAAADAKSAQDRTNFNNRLSSSYSTALDEARQYFTQMGLDPEQFMGAISQGANSRKSSVPELDGSPGSYFSGLGNTVFDQLTTAERAKAGRGIDAFAGAGFDSRLISNESDDATIQAILGEQEQERRSYADNLRARGVVTDTGYNSALESINKQRFGVQNNIDEISRAVLEGGRSNLRGIASEGRTGAANVNLGQAFNPEDFFSRINTEASGFLENLGSNVRSKIGENFFDMSSILTNAGRGQGAQNTAFNPAAFFGANIDEEDDTRTGGNSAFNSNNSPALF